VGNVAQEENSIMKSFTVIGVGNLARNPELIALRFEGRTAIVTGAGGNPSLGRGCVALE
jgi:hypothetical protein